MNLPSQIFFNNSNLGNRAATLKENTLWLLPFYMAVATYCYYERVCKTMCTAIAIPPKLVKSLDLFLDVSFS